MTVWSSWRFGNCDNRWYQTGIKSIPDMIALPTTPVKLSFNVPLVTLTVKVRTTAVLAPPAAAKTSKLLRITLPWALTLNLRFPDEL